MKTTAAEDDVRFMRRALELAASAKGCVEPNPMVGCVVVRENRIILEGAHRFYGGPHAEADALAGVQPNQVRGATIYVTLEPCSHFGKTPPCCELLARFEPARVVVAMQDPFGRVAGRGIQYLRDQGIEVAVGICEAEAIRLNAPYLQLQRAGRPWVAGKWAMTIDGKIATSTGASFWISGDESRKKVHRLRALVDAILIGSGTACADDPMLNPREGGPRIPLRVVFDSQAKLSPQSKLAQTSQEFPTLIWASQNAAAARIDDLRAQGCEVCVSPHPTTAARLRALIEELGRRRCTNLMCEGGAGLLGALFDQQLLDEVHVFVAPKIFGGEGATSPLAGIGVKKTAEAPLLDDWHTSRSGNDIYLNGIVRYVTT